MVPALHRCFGTLLEPCYILGALCWRHSPSLSRLHSSHGVRGGPTSASPTVPDPAQTHSFCRALRGVRAAASWTFQKERPPETRPAPLQGTRSPPAGLTPAAPGRHQDWPARTGVLATDIRLAACRGIGARLTSSVRSPRRRTVGPTALDPLAPQPSSSQASPTPAGPAGAPLAPALPRGVAAGIPRDSEVIALPDWAGSPGCSWPRRGQVRSRRDQTGTWQGRNGDAVGTRIGPDRAFTRRRVPDRVPRGSSGARAGPLSASRWALAGPRRPGLGGGPIGVPPRSPPRHG